LDFVFFIKNARIYSLSLSLSLSLFTFFRYLSRFERWRETAERERERERERETEERLFTRRANSFSLFLFGARFLSRRSGFPTGEESRKRRGDKEREREKGFIANENAQKRAKYGPDDFDVALVVSSSSARTFYNNTANDDFKSVLPPVCPVTFGAFLRPNVPAGHQRATAKIHLSNRDE
jgi:hypothetical protein